MSGRRAVGSAGAGGDPRPPGEPSVPDAARGDAGCNGLQAERTLLSWQRTLILLIGVALLYVRDPFQTGGLGAGGDPLLRLFPVLGVLVALGVLIAHLRRRWRATGHGLRDDRTGRPPAPVARPWALVLASAAVALLAVAVGVSAVAG